MLIFYFGEVLILKNKERAQVIFNELLRVYPDAHCELDHKNAFELLIATILSAQTTDVRVNQVTPILFKKYPTPETLSEAALDDVEEIIRSTGFYKNKAKNIIACAKELNNIHEGMVPKDLESLVALPGVGRKTANVVLGNAFNINEGIVVDTHVKRLAGLFQFTGNTDPSKVERDLIKLFKREDWTMVSHLLIFHGRRRCVARKPQCDLCEVANNCPSFQ